MTMRKCLIAAILVGITYTGFAQNKAVDNPGAKPIWTKRVSRLITLGDTVNNNKTKLRDESNKVNLAEILTDNVLKGKLLAYTTMDSKLTQTINHKQLNELINGVPDTFEIEDPVTRKKVTKVITIDFNYAEVTHYRILEEWAFDKQTAKTTIQIVAIAPVKDQYGDDGSFRGRTSMFWLKYADVKSILDQYEITHPNANVALGVWNSYFTETEK